MLVVGVTALRSSVQQVVLQKAQTERWWLRGLLLREDSATPDGRKLQEWKVMGAQIQWEMGPSRSVPRQAPVSGRWAGDGDRACGQQLAAHGDHGGDA